MKRTVLLALLLCVSAFARKEVFVIENDCQHPMACIEITGPYSWAMARVEGIRYEFEQADSTCCQLAAGLAAKICADGYDSLGVKARCE